MAEPDTIVAVRPAPAKPAPKPLPRWHVVLLDDDEHTYDYVISMMTRVCGHSADQGRRIARNVDLQGRAVCLTTHRELAELKRDQLLAFGADPLLARSSGSMRAVLEPAE